MEMEVTGVVNKIELSSRANLSSLHNEVIMVLDNITGGNLEGDAVESVEKILIAIYRRINSLPYVDLFHTYKECLTYYQHLCKDKVYLLAYMEHRCDFIVSCEHWREYEQGAAVAYDVLLSIDRLSSEEDEMTSILPRRGSNNTDEKTAMCVFRVSYFLLRMWRDISTANKRYYVNVRNIILELKPWLSHMNDPVGSEYVNLKDIATFLRDFSLSVFEKRELNYVTECLHFCKETFSLYEKALMIDQIFEFGNALCRSYFSNLEDDYFRDSTIIQSVFRNIVKQKEIYPDKEQFLENFMELVSYCIVNYSTATTKQRYEMAMFFDDLEEKKLPELNLKFCGLLLVINHVPESYQKWFNFTSTDDVDFSIPNFLIRLEFQLQNLTHINLQERSTLFSVFFDGLSNIVLSNAQEIIGGGLPCIKNASDAFIDDFHAICKFEKKKGIDRQTVNALVKLAVATSVLNGEISDSVAKLLAIENEFQAIVLKFLYEQLHQVSIAFHSANRFKEAIMFLEPCCEAAWKQVSNFCNTLKSETCVSTDNFLGESIIDWVNRACEDSALYVSILFNHSNGDVSTRLGGFFDRWVSAQKEFALMIPAALVTQWVEIQTEQIDGTSHEAWDNVQTIDLLVSSELNSEPVLVTILEEERHMYNDKCSNQKFLSQMNMTIDDKISNMTSTLDERYYLSRPQYILDCGIRLISCGRKGQTDGIHYISEAIKIMIDLKDKEKATPDHLCPLLFKAYCSRAFCKRILHPQLKEYMEDINDAFELWSKQKHVTLSETDIYYFFQVADLLCFEGHTLLHAHIFNIMINIIGKDKMNAFIDIAWQSGNLSHSLCGSPINDEFIKSGSLSDSMLVWKNSMKRNSIKVLFEESFLILPTLSSSLSDDNDSHAIGITESISKFRDTIECLKDNASSRPKVLDPEKAFVSARMSYDFAQILIKNGLMVEALTYATQGYYLREKLFSQYFVADWKKTKEDVDVGGNIENMTTYVCENFNLRSSSHSPTKSYGFYNNESVYLPTPWNVVKCYLESALQIGSIGVITAKGSVNNILLRAKEISYVLDLPIFLTGFSITLGKLYHREGLLNLALKEVADAENQLKKCTSLSCNKCKSIMEVAINQQLGDIHLSLFKRNKDDEDFNKAEKLYLRAKDTLHSDVWINDVSRPHVEGANDPTFCNTIGVGNGSVETCWHCVPSIIEKSSSVQRSIHMIWECHRRRVLLRLLSRIAKCYRLREDYENERMSLLSSLSVLVCQNMFSLPNLSIGLIKRLVENNVKGDTFGIQHATILYDISSFSLRCIYSKDLRVCSERAIFSLQTVISGLKLASTLCREDHKLYRKVSQLLVVLYAPSSIDKAFSISSSTAISESQWASYFHQASIGTYVNPRFLARMTEHYRYVLAPRTVKELERSVLEFFKLLPAVAILSISILEDISKKLFSHLLPDSDYSTWIVLSRMGNDCGPLIVILPLNKIFTDLTIPIESSSCRWVCPWSNKECDRIALVLKLILEQDLMVLHVPSVMTKRTNIDLIFENFLRDLEDSWFGSCKHLFLRKLSDDIGHDSKCREPMIIVPDLNIQAIPWENLPILRQEVVYRMPSVGIILYTYYHCKETTIDPLKSFYLINPSGDASLEAMGTYFEELSMTDGLEGVVNKKPSKRKLEKALEEVDLFVYVGHGDGRKYIPGESIAKIKGCAAAFLGGCASGYISYSRSRTPHGAPLDYLLAKSRLVIANMWTVCDLDMSQFTRAMFEEWLKLKSSRLVNCTKGEARKRKFDDYQGSTNCLCIHGFDVASPMSKVRGAGSFKYIMGAAPVCYGIPTSVVQNKM